MNTLWAPGKLLLTGEYFVLDGAAALAVPTKLGQKAYIDTQPSERFEVRWKATQGKNILMDSIYIPRNTSSQTVHTDSFSTRFEFILNQIIELKPDLLHSKTRYNVHTELEFPADYGLGSSSTLIVLAAQIFNVCPYRLNAITFKSSGYDVAVAIEKRALLFKKKLTEVEDPSVKKITYRPTFSSDLIFIHLNLKKDSRQAIDRYNQSKSTQEDIEKISSITEKIKEAHSLEDFSALMIDHENIVAKRIEEIPVKQRLFPDLKVFVKSLGAWGGDFVLSQKFDGYQDYFSKLGFNTLYSWEEMVHDENQTRFIH